MRLLFLVMFCAAAARAEKLQGGGAGMNGIWVDFETRLEPGSPGISHHGGGTLTEKGVAKRHICNFDNNTYFGYDLTMEPLPDGKARLKFSPLSITPAKMAEIFKEVPKWTALPLPGGPVSLDVLPGETVALDLFVNSWTGQKVTDYLTVKGSGRRNVMVEGPAKDFSVEDVVLAISSPRGTVDGKEAFSSAATISGHAIWLDVPGHGRFVFSLAPRPDLGMHRMGEIRGTVIRWQAGGHRFEISTDRPVIDGLRAYNLYGVAVPRAVEQFFMSAGTKPENALSGRR